MVMTRAALPVFKVNLAIDRFACHAGSMMADEGAGAKSKIPARAGWTAAHASAARMLDSACPTMPPLTSPKELLS
jgi:hypothetical protein